MRIYITSNLKVLILVGILHHTYILLIPHCFPHFPTSKTLDCEFDVGMIFWMVTFTPLLFCCDKFWNMSKIKWKGYWVNSFLNNSWDGSEPLISRKILCAGTIVYITLINLGAIIIERWESITSLYLVNDQHP